MEIIFCMHLYNVSVFNSFLRLNISLYVDAFFYPFIS